MTNSLVQQLFKHIATLQLENDSLKKTIDKHTAQVQKLCSITGFENWQCFLEWAQQQFPTDELQKRQRFSNSHFNCNTQSLERKLFSSRKEDLPIISEECSQASSNISSIEMEGKISREFFDSFKSLGTSHEFEKGSKRRLQEEQEQQFSQIEMIVMENANLRKEIGGLRQELQNTKSSLYSLAALYKNQQKDINTTYCTSIKDISQSSLKSTPFRNVTNEI